MDLEATIAQEVRKQAAAAGTTAEVAISRHTPLIDTGLDSLGFTTLVIDLERQLGVDPFGGDSEIVYPETFGELVDLYVGALGQ